MSKTVRAKFGRENCKEYSQNIAVPRHTDWKTPIRAAWFMDRLFNLRGNNNLWIPRVRARSSLFRSALTNKQ